MISARTSHSGSPRELVVQKVRSPSQFRSGHAFSEVDDLVQNLFCVRGDDDENSCVVQQDELDVVELTGAVGHQRETQMVRGARELMRDVGKHIADGTGLTQPSLNLWSRTGSAARIEEEIHVGAIALVRRHSPGRGVGLMDVAELLEFGHHMTDCG